MFGSRLRVARNVMLFACNAMLVLAIALAAWPSEIHAEEASTPIYNPASKSYFQLVTTGGAQTNATWARAQNDAQSRVFKGVRGRLAVVDSSDTHRFLMEHLPAPGEAWIGLRYWCKYRRMQWTSGNVADAASFQYWAPDWNRDPSVSCDKGGISFMGVYYLPRARGFVWQAVGQAKGFRHYYVEYPAGRS